MVDNFDRNVARRKPNTVHTKRPLHPWDVILTDTADNEREDYATPTHDAAPLVSEPIGDSALHAQKNIESADHTPPGNQSDLTPSRSSPPESPESSGTPVYLEKPRTEPDGTSLSDNISLHSNFCKLDNDISDYLLPKLSVSAQSVYIRLYRQSYGWNRNWASESLQKLTQFCNLSLQTVRKAIRELEIMGCIRKEFNDYHKATVYHVFLPSDIGIGNTAPDQDALSNIRGLNFDSQNLEDQFSIGQHYETSNFSRGGCQNLDPKSAKIRGLEFNTQSVFFRGTSVYNILECGKTLPKDILIYINERHIARAVHIIDEFYTSIGFSVVSRALYRKSLLDFFDMVKSGFSDDDIRYAVRWTFKNARSRPESFALIKHTLHLAMNDLIQDLKNQAVEKEVWEKKKEAIRKNSAWKNQESTQPVSEEHQNIWREVMEDLRATVNEHSFAAFIEPLRLDGVEGNTVYLSAPPDSVSWVSDHYTPCITECCRNRMGKDMVIEFR